MQLPLSKWDHFSSISRADVRCMRKGIHGPGTKEHIFSVRFRQAFWIKSAP